MDCCPPPLQPHLPRLLRRFLVLHAVFQHRCTCGPCLRSPITPYSLPGMILAHGFNSQPYGMTAHVQLYPSLWPAFAQGSNMFTAQNCHGSPKGALNSMGLKAHSAPRPPSPRLNNPAALLLFSRLTGTGINIHSGG